MRRAAARLISFALLASVGAAALADTPIEQNVDSRLQLGFQAPEAELQKWLPAPWQVNALAAPPSAKGVNLGLLFVQRLQSQTPDGKPIARAPSELYAVLTVFAKHAKSGEEGLFIGRIYSPDAAGLPGPYKNSVLAQVRRELSLRGEGLSPGSASDQWQVNVASGGGIALRLAYERPLPMRMRSELRPRSSVDPDFYRIYRFDQGVELLKSAPAGIDRLKSYELRVTVPELAPLFERAQLLSVAALPWYVRQLSLPAAQ